MKHIILATLAFVVLGTLAAVSGAPANEALHVLPPITRGNLSIFPVVGGTDYDTSRLITLDEGVRAGTVIITEKGSLQGLVRGNDWQAPRSEAEVNRLVLINKSDRPLLLLAGEIVTGGKQDRVIGADRLVPAKSDPIDLAVFCVEPGRWTGQTAQFGSMKSQMAQPSVRVPAMAARNQQEVWNQVGAARDAIVLNDRAAASGGSHSTSSYAATMAAPRVQERIDTVAGHYENILGDLRKSGAKGVVVAINGNIEWADLFASDDLLSKYWEKLIRSYAAESLTTVSGKGEADQKTAQRFLDRLSGNREVIETEPGAFRRTETTGDGYKVFTLTGLTPKLDFTVHTAKMTCENRPRSPFMPLDYVR